MHNFEMSDLGFLHYFLGIEVIQDSNGIFISQRKYASDLLKRCGMSNCAPARTPMNHNEMLILIDGVEKADEIFFRSMVGGLIFLSHKASYHVCCEHCF